MGIASAPESASAARTDEEETEEESEREGEAREGPPMEHGKSFAVSILHGGAHGGGEVRLRFLFAPKLSPSSTPLSSTSSPLAPAIVALEREGGE